MLRHGNGPAPQEGDYYGDKLHGVVYLRHGGSWMPLSYHELSAEVREAYAQVGFVFDTEYQAQRPESTKVMSVIQAAYVEAKAYVDANVEPMTTSQPVEPPDLNAGETE